MKNIMKIILTILITPLLAFNVSAANIISSDSIEKAIAYAYNIKDTNPSRFSGYCAAFVWRCYHDGAGLGNSSYATAREMGDALITSTDTNPPRGAFVFWYDSNGPSTKAGHVALSLGDGNVIHAYSDVKVTSIETVNNSHYIYRGWGAPIAEYRLETATPPEPIELPSNCWLNIDKGGESTYTASETVKFTYHAENVNYYTLEIYKDGSSYDCFDTYSGVYSRAFTETGHYSAVVSAVNGGGRTYSGWISWNVVSTPAPSNCYISIDRGPESTYNVSDTVNFTYHAENVKYYIFEIYKDGASYECTETYYGQYSRTFTQPGRYNSVVTAVGDGGRTSSGWISWNVVNPSAVGPNVPYVAVNNRNLFPQEQFRINFWAETAKYYNVKITKNGVVYKDEILYVGYYDTSLSEPGDYSIQVTAINDYGSSSAYDGVKVIGTVPEEPKITTTYDCYSTNEDVEIVLTPGKYTQTSYMTIRKCTNVWETVFSDSVTDLTTKTYRFTTAGYYQIEYQNSNIYGASPCAAKAIRIYDSVPDKPMVLSDKSIYEISENINVTLLPGGNTRSAYMSVYNSSDELVFSQDVSGRETQTLSFDVIGEYTINYQTANTLGQSEIAVLTFCVGKKETVVSFDANGSVVEEPNKTVLRDSPYGELPIPHCQGKKFVGWFTKVENGELIESDTIVTALDDHILYAVWQDLPSTETTIMKKSNYSVVNITVHNLDEVANVVLATYKNGTLSDIQIEEYNGGDLSLATLLPYDTIKVMLWKDMSSMNPLCENEVLH
ncbi:MAG: hypothetical protein E7389_04360 [Ruminococcaceae bacterium]|nr:hypothetical protein [Oscillospiraceae bacterium]